MANESVGNSMGKKGSTGQFMRQGHTAAPVNGSDPNVTPMGQAGVAPRELKP